MTQQHTRGRLVVNPIRLDQICTADGSACIAAANRDAAPPLEVMANARRLVACWNACECIPTELIEKCGGVFDILQAVAGQRDELLTALKFYADPKRYEGPNQKREADDEFTPEGDFYRIDVSRDNGDRARAAIAKVKGGAA